jgi:glyoxylase-like metal-dependent hydrolase (beta-lactamase superfamily II)
LGGIEDAAIRGCPLRALAEGRGKVEPLQADRDVFGDGRVRILKMPDITEGHQALLVRLAGGPVLISGDQYHFAERTRRSAGVPAST